MGTGFGWFLTILFFAGMAVLVLRSRKNKERATFTVNPSSLPKDDPNYIPPPAA